MLAVQPRRGPSPTPFLQIGPPPRRAHIRDPSRGGGYRCISATSAHICRRVSTKVSRGQPPVLPLAWPRWQSLDPVLAPQDSPDRSPLGPEPAGTDSGPLRTDVPNHLPTSCGASSHRQSVDPRCLPQGSETVATMTGGPLARS